MNKYKMVEARTGGIGRRTLVTCLAVLFVFSMTMGYQWAKLEASIYKLQARPIVYRNPLGKVYAFLWESDESQNGRSTGPYTVQGQTKVTARIPATITVKPSGSTSSSIVVSMASSEVSTVTSSPRTFAPSVTTTTQSKISTLSSPPSTAHASTGTSSSTTFAPSTRISSSSSSTKFTTTSFASDETSSGAARSSSFTVQSSPSSTKVSTSSSTTSTSKLMYENSNLTVVTAYFDLGSFAKGSTSNVFTKDKYMGWMKVFKHIQNPLVAYFDTNETLEYFRKLRADLPEQTRLILVKRSELWSFSIKDRIGEIYKNPSYPKFLPNTVKPEYSCAMHAKYEVMQAAAQKNYFNTTYFCWLDIGLFRDISGKDDNFKLALPKGFNPNRIAYQGVTDRDAGLKPKDIFRGNRVWICGCFFLGEKDLMVKWTNLYKDYVMKYLNQGLMNTDQQILYSMFSTYNNQPKPAIELQVYRPDGRFNRWFSLGYLCKEAGKK